MSALLGDRIRHLGVIMSANVLVIDSSNAIKKVIEIALKNTAVKLTLTSSVEEAAPLVGLTKFAAVIMDASFISMYQTLAASFESNSVPYLIVLFGSNAQTTEADLRVKGADHVLKKPFDPKALKNLMDGFASEEPDTTTIETNSTKKSTPADHSGEDILDQIHTIVDKAQLQEVSASNSTDTNRKGRRAFAEQASEAVKEKIVQEVAQTSSRQPTIGKAVTKQPVVAQREGAQGDQVAISEEVENLIANQLPHLIQKEVSRYCEEHFDELARSVVETELRRLAMERARHLVDN